MWYCRQCGASNQDSLAACFSCGTIPAGIAGELPIPGRGEYTPYPGYPAYPPVVRAPVLAGFWMRFAALIIDNALLQFVTMPFFFLLYLLAMPNIGFHGRAEFPAYFWLLYALLMLLNLALHWGYNIFMLGRYQATLGKKALGLVVVRTDAQPLDYKTIVIRETVGKMLSALACNLGYIWAGFDERKQAWHDKLARTYVISTK